MTKAIRPQRIDKTAPIFALKRTSTICGPGIFWGGTLTWTVSPYAPTISNSQTAKRNRKSQQRSCLSTHLWLNKRFIRHKEGHREANATESLSEKAADQIGISNFKTCKTQGFASPQSLSNVGVSKNMGFYPPNHPF